MTRDNAMTIRLSAEERAALEEVAKQEDMPASIIVRRGIKREIERIKQDQKRGKRP